MYNFPGVHIKRVQSTRKPAQGVSTSVAGFVGVTSRGVVNTPVMINSWTEFVNNFSDGINSPFLKNSYLAHAVYGFFRNGGTQAYIVRAIGANPESASTIIPTTTGLKYIAKDLGTWGNTLTVAITNNTATEFVINVKMGIQVLETLIVDKDVLAPNYFLDEINNNSKYLKVEIPVDGELNIGEGTLTLGTNGTSIVAQNFVDALQSFNDIKVNIIAIPGEVETAVLSGVSAYANTRKDCIAVLDAPRNTEIDTLLLSGIGINDYTAIYAQWIGVVDPTSQAKFVVVPPSGHIMGMYSRLDGLYGIHKAPAGEASALDGVLFIEDTLTAKTMFDEGVNFLLAKKGIGIVVWGARTTSNIYVSSVRLGVYISQSVYELTQYAVFEPIDEVLMVSVESTLKSFLYALWKDMGALKGVTPEEAYYVKCDAELNPVETQIKGELHAEIGYADKKPAEFVVVKITQTNV